MSRRNFVAGLMAAAGSASAGRLFASPGDGFPLPRYRERFENWARELAFDDLWTCAPRAPQEVADVANWCATNHYALRPRGTMHNWSPLSLASSTSAQTPVILADTVPYLNRMEMDGSFGVPAVRVETGARMEDLLAFLETQGCGFTAVPAVGVITVGGALAIDGHGAAIPALGERRLQGQSYGSLSNRVLSLTAVVWNANQSRYVVKRFLRSDPQIAALLVHAGRAFITEVTLAVEPNYNLRCRSYVTIPASELFAPPGNGARDITSFLDASGRIEAIWYPFTDNPWLKVWTVSPQKPPLARPVTRPYNYPFSDQLPQPVVDLAQRLVTGYPQGAPEFGAAVYAATAAGLAGTASTDLWGASKNTLLFIRPTTLRITELSYVVLTRRDRVQQVISDFAARYSELLAAYRAQDRYPVNMPVEIRVSGLDRATDVGVTGARAPLISAIAPRPDHPEWDTAVWLSILTLPGTPDHCAFFREMERWIIARYSGSSACARPEWSKGWAYSNDAAWSDPEILGQFIPQSHRAGKPANGGWDTAVRQLRALDGGNIYRNDFHAALGM